MHLHGDQQGPPCAAATNVQALGYR